MTDCFDPNSWFTYALNLLYSFPDTLAVLRQLWFGVDPSPNPHLVNLRRLVRVDCDSVVGLDMPARREHCAEIRGDVLPRPMGPVTHFGTIRTLWETTDLPGQA